MPTTEDELAVAVVNTDTGSVLVNARPSNTTPAALDKLLVAGGPHFPRYGLPASTDPTYSVRVYLLRERDATGSAHILAAAHGRPLPSGGLLLMTLEAESSALNPDVCFYASQLLLRMLHYAMEHHVELAVAKSQKPQCIGVAVAAGYHLVDRGGVLVFTYDAGADVTEEGLRAYIARVEAAANPRVAAGTLPSSAPVAAYRHVQAAQRRLSRATQKAANKSVRKTMRTSPRPVATSRFSNQTKAGVSSQSDLYRRFLETHATIHTQAYLLHP